MRGFRRRRRAPAPAVEQREGTGQIPAGPTGPPSDPRAAMRRIAAEAVILGMKPRRSFGARGPGRASASWRHAADPSYGASSASETCFRGGCDDPADEERRRQLDAILHHHALAVWVALDLLAYEWRSEKIARQLDALDGLGHPAVQLDQLYAELSGRSTEHHADAIARAS